MANKIAWLFCLLMVFCSLGCMEFNNTRVCSCKAIPVILDTDIGSDIDDMWAIIMMLNSPELDVKLITVSTGDVETRGLLTAKLLKLAGREDIPIGIGSPSLTEGSRISQAEWLGDFQWSDFRGKVYRDGTDALVDTIMNSPKTIKLIAVGPCPTIGDALKMEPRIAEKAEFVGMQGHISTSDELPYPEYNVRLWPEGLDRALKADWKKTITPLNTCDKVQLDSENYLKILNSKKLLPREMIAAYRQWREDRDKKHKRFDPDNSTSTLYDTVAIYLAYSDKLLKMETLKLSVTEDGRTIIDPKNGNDVNVALEWKDLDAFEKLLTERICR